jgi:hypothetical protein
MPRKPKLDKQTITVLINSTPITVTLHPPTGSRKSWYAYWNGLVSSKSTGQADLSEAIKVVEGMLHNDGQRATIDDSVLTDDDFVALQVAHFGRKTDRRRKREPRRRWPNASTPSPPSRPSPGWSASQLPRRMTAPASRRRP